MKLPKNAVSKCCGTKMVIKPFDGVYFPYCKKCGKVCLTWKERQ